MENQRIIFPKKQRMEFFKQLKKKTKTKTTRELAKKLNLSPQSLGLYMRGERTIPFSLVKKWITSYLMNLEDFNYKSVSISETLKKASRKGIKILKEKLGKNWNKKIGKKGNESLRKKFRNDKKLEDKWKASVKKSLVKKYGKKCYIKMGEKGGRKLMAKLSLEQKRKLHEKAFKNSFKRRIIFAGQKFRSFKEVEVAKFLLLNEIDYKYEPKVLNFYPDFLIKNKVLIEVVGFRWRPHIERTLEKIHKFLDINYKIIVYTYPNLSGYFKDLPVLLIDKEQDLNKIFELINRE